VRKIAAGIVAVALAAGCAQNQQAGSAAHPEVVFLASARKVPFAVQAVDGFKYGAGQVAGVSARVVAPESIDPVGQMNLFQQEVTAGTKSISLAIPFGEQSDDPVSAAAEKGVQIIAVDTPPLPGSPVKLYVGNDNDSLGRLLADTVADRLGPGTTGRIVLGSPRNGLAQLDFRALGFRERMNERLPKVRIVGPLDVSDRSTAADTLWAGLIRSNPGAAAYVSVGANGALLAGLRTRLHASWLAASFDVEAEALPAVQRGELVLVDPEHFLKGAVTGKLQAEQAARGTALPEGWLAVPGLAVTRANVAEITARDATEQSRQAWYQSRLDELLGKNGPQMRPLEQAQ
jgi:ribose transport system substrate-binding protein